MKQYMLSIYQPDGDPPPPDVLAKVMRDVYAVRDELKGAGAWVFAGGLHAPSTATVAVPELTDPFRPCTAPRIREPKRSLTSRHQALY